MSDQVNSRERRMKSHKNGSAQYAPTEKSFGQRLTGIIPDLRRFGFGLCRSWDLADDLAQETAFKAWKARDSFDPQRSIKAWTFVILRNTFITALRRNKFKADYSEDLALRLADAPDQQENCVELSELYDALTRLKPNQRDALLLIGAGGYSYTEAAAICGTKEGTIKSRVSRARAILASKFDRIGFSSLGRPKPKHPSQFVPQLIYEDIARICQKGPNVLPLNDSRC